ncbi:MAG: hypothetical protein AAGM38_13425 [Pseudomonadota bacterium]
MTTSRSKPRRGRRARAAAIGLAALAGLLLPSPPTAAAEGAPTPRDLERIETETRAIVAAAAGGGTAGLRDALESCWRASAGYAVEALAPCALKERAAQVLIDLLGEVIGPIAAPDLTAAESAARIKAAYAARDTEPPAAPEWRPLIRYALARRVKPGWADTPSLSEIGEAARRRISETEGDTQGAASDCWVRMALEEPRAVPPALLEAGWDCRLIELMAGGPPERAVEERRRFFERATGADPEADAAMAAVAAVIWPDGPWR